MKWFLRVLLALLLIIVVAVGVGLRVLPDQARSYINENGKDLLGRTLVLGGLDISYSQFSVQLDSFYIMDKNDSAHLLKIDTLHVDVDFKRLLQGDYFLESALISGLDVYVEQQGDQFSFNDIIKHLTSDTTVQNIPEDTTASNNDDPIRYGLLNVEFRRSNITFYDRNVDNRLAIRNFRFLLPSLKWDEKMTHSDLSFDLPKGGEIDLDLDYDLEDNRYRFEVDIRDLYLAFLKPYAQQSLKISDLNGRVNNHLVIEGDALDSRDIQVHGSVSVQDFIVLDQKEGDLFKLDSLGISIDSVSVKDRVAAIQNVVLKGPTIAVLLTKSGTSFDELLIENQGADNEMSVESSAPESDSTWSFSLDKFKLEKGQFLLADVTTGERFDYLIKNIVVESEPISSSSEELSLNLSQNMGKGGLLELKVDYNLAQENTFSAQLDLKGLVLKDFTPFSLYYLGNPIESGGLDYETSLKADNGLLTSDHNMHLSNFFMGGRENKDAEQNLPVNFALALLRDQDKNIDLEYEIEGDMNDPDFNMRGLIWKTLANVVIKTVAAPGNFIGSSLGVDSDKISSLEMSSLATELTIKQQEQLNDVAIVLRKMDELKATFIQYPNDSAIAEGMALQDCLFDYYLTEKPKKRGKVLSQKDTLKAMEYRQQQEFLDFMQCSDPDSLSWYALAKKSITPYQIELNRNTSNREGLVKQFLLEELGVHADRISFKTGPINRREEVLFQIEYGSMVD